MELARKGLLFLLLGLANGPMTMTSSALVTGTVTATASAAIATQVGNLPPVGSIPRDYSPAGLERLWNIVSVFIYFYDAHVLLGWAGRTSTIHHDACANRAGGFAVFSTGYVSQLLCSLSSRCSAQSQFSKRIQIRRCNGRISSRRRCQKRRQRSYHVGLGEQDIRIHHR